MRISTVRLVANEATHLTRLLGQPCSRRRCISLPGRTASKAPLTSRVSRLAVKPSFRARSTSWVRQVVRSIADLQGRAPNCCLEITFSLTAIQANLFARRRSSALPKTDSKAIGRYERGEERSVLFGFGRITKTARRKQRGW